MLNEGVKSESFILQLGNVIYNDIVNQIQTEINKDENNLYDAIFNKKFGLNVEANALIDEYSFKNDEKKVALAKRLRLHFFNAKSHRAKAYYNTAYNEIVFVRSFMDLKDTYDSVKTRLYKLENTVDIRDVLTNLEEELLHELHHWHDRIISSNKYRDNKSSKRYHEIMSPENIEPTSYEHDLYLKLPHEVIARFIAFLPALKREYFENGSQLLDYFRRNFQGWSKLGQNARRALLRKATYYYKMKTNYRDFVIRKDDKARLNLIKQKYGKLGVFIEYIGTYKNGFELQQISDVKYIVNVANDMVSTINKSSYLYIPVGLVDGENYKKLSQIGFVRGEKIDPKMKGWLVKQGEN